MEEKTERMGDILYVGMREKGKGRGRITKERANRFLKGGKEGRHYEERIVSGKIDKKKKERGQTGGEKRKRRREGK